MTFRQFLATLPMAILCATLWLGLLYFALVESKSPSNLPDFTMPLAFVPCIVASYYGIRQLYRHIGDKAIAIFPMLAFLSAIPLYLVMEVTIL